VRGLGPLLGEEVGTLAPFVEAGVLDAAAVHVARLIARTVPGVEPEVLLGAALATRAPGFGHVCVVIGSVAGSVVVEDGETNRIGSLPWPEPERWARILAESPAVRKVADPAGDVILPLVFDGTRLYLERYWRFEERVAEDLSRRARYDGGLAVASPELDQVLQQRFEAADDAQRKAARTALNHRIAVIAGGPGTGKTSTVSRLLGAAYEIALGRGQQLDVALAAPTGKAASRMEAVVHEAVPAPELPEAVAQALVTLKAKTLHRLLGMAFGGSPRYDSRNRLPHDLVVVDETSMVSLPLMARLLDAVRPDATLVLVGDPFQLASVEAGAVLGDIVGPMSSDEAVGPLSDDIVVLTENHRFAPDSEIAALANAIRGGKAEVALEIMSNARSGELEWLDPEKGDPALLAQLHEDVADNAAEVVRAARSGQGEEGLRLAAEVKVLCATRFGPLGVSGWTTTIESRVKGRFPDAGIGGRHYLGRPIIVTRNDYLNEVFNGDVGLEISGSAGPAAALRRADGTLRTLALSQLEAIETWWATTIHKSQGSEFERVIISLPPASPILTRELLYTAVTRAKKRVTVVASAASIRAAVTKPVARASGLQAKLWPERRPPGPATTGGRRSGEVRQLRFDV
jgi:exodeoxyribonuclease V alpha subunit